MKTETDDTGAGTPIEAEPARLVHTVGTHYDVAVAANAGQAIAADAREMAATEEPEYDVPGTHDVVDSETGIVLAPDVAPQVAREEGEGGTVVSPPRSPTEEDLRPEVDSQGK